MFKISYQHRDQFWEWCMENHIACEYMGTTPIEETDTWYIGNERDRMLSILRWS